MKKIIALALCLLMVFGMVACGNTAAPNEIEAQKGEIADQGKEAAKTATAKDTAGTEQAAQMASGEKPYEGETLTVWTSYEQGTQTVEVVDAWIARFEELSGADVQVKHWGTDLQTMLYPALDAGTEDIDVFLTGSTIQLELQKAHALDLTEYYENSDMSTRAYPIHMDIIKDVGEGAIYAIPTVSSFSAFWYNQDIFDAAGITEVPETIEEFEAACDAIVAAGYYPMALDSAYATSTFGALVERTVGEKVVGEMAKNGGFAKNDRFVAACQKVIDWMAKGYFEPDAPGVWPASQNRIGLMKDTAMVYTGMWVSGEIEAACEEKLNWGCMKFPYDPTCEDGTYGASVSCTCNMINKDTDTPDLAWDYLYFMCTGDADKAITDIDDYLVNDMTQTPLPKFEGAKVIMESTSEVVNYAGGLHDNVDIKTSINEVVTNLYSGTYKTGLEAAQAFDALVK